MMASNLERNFVRALASALQSLKVPIVCDYRVPGSDYIIDLFIPSLPRAAIEVKCQSSAHDLLQLQQSHELFAGRLLSFWIYLGADVPQNLQSNRQENSFALHVPVSSTESICADAVATAGEIFQTLTRICEQRFGHKLTVDAAAEKVRETAEPYSQFGHGADKFTLGAHEAFYALGNQELPTVKTTRSLLYALKCLLPPERYAVFQHELKQLENEFREGHFTACALRVGRSLELIVYGAAKAWGVRLDDRMFSLIEDLQRRLQSLNSAIIDYRDADSQIRSQKKLAVQRLGADFASQLNSLGFLLDDEEVQMNSIPPRNIEAILRDVRKTHGRFQTVRDEIKAVIDSGLIRAILDVRNDAAHSNLDGEAREVSEETVINMLENVHVLVHKLSLVGEVIVTGETRSNTRT